MPGRRLVAAIDLGGTKIRSLVVEESGVVVAAEQRPTEAELGYAAVVERIVGSVSAALTAAEAESSELYGVGVSAPGPVDFDAGVLLEAPNLPGFHEVRLGALLRERLGAPAYLENDANAAAVGEHRFGAGRGVRDMIYLTISTGIGGGLILNGQLYRGVDGTAGELGHVVVDERGPLHACGLRGCLEVMASGTAIGRLANEAVDRAGAEAGRSLLGGAAPLGRLTAKEVHDAAEQGDELAQWVLRQTAHSLAVGLADYINIFNPQLFVIGGSAGQIWQQLVQPAFDEARRMAFARPAATVQLLPAALHPDSGALGVAALTFDALARGVAAID
jgi:glucokinase